MQVSDLQVIKDIPGFKVIVKAILKSQIQQMVEQLAEYTGEESVLLTASVSDGSLTHLGSESGKSFLEDHDDIKSQFLGFCLKRYHRQKQLELASQNDLLSPGIGQSSPRKFGPISRQRGPKPHVITPPQPPQIYPVALVKPDAKSTRGSSKSVRHDPYPVGVPRHPLPPRPKPVLNEGIDLYSHQRFSNFPTESAVTVEKIADDSFTRNMQEALKVKLEALNSGTDSDTHSDNLDDSNAPRCSPHGYHNAQESVGYHNAQESVEHSQSPTHSEEPEIHQRLVIDTVSSEDVRTNDRLLHNQEHDEEYHRKIRRASEADNGNDSPMSDHREIKVEIAQESEMELEITGMDPGQVPRAGENWVSNMQDMIGSIPAGSVANGPREATQDVLYHRNSPTQHRSPGLPHGASSFTIHHMTPAEAEGRWSKYSSDNKKSGWQRLLPESATQVMKAWLFRNIMNPYPPDDVKQEMMRQTNLSLVQINNWFTNARRRIIQPMLEANNTKEAIEKLARYTSHHRTWSFNAEGEGGEDQKPISSQSATPSAKLPVTQPQPAPDSIPVEDEDGGRYDSMEPDDLSMKNKTS